MHGGGVNNGKFIRASDGHIYFGKKIDEEETKNHCANEIVAWGLAREIGLQHPGPVLIHDGDTLWLGTKVEASALPPPHPYLSEALLRDCENESDVYRIVIFDIWICNLDRNADNLLATCGAVKRSGSAVVGCRMTPHKLWVIDHTEAMLTGGMGFAELNQGAASKSLKSYPWPEFFRHRINDTRSLLKAMNTVLDVKKPTIEQVVATVPRELLKEGSPADWVDFLVERQSKLRGILRTGRAVFPNLDPSAI